MSLENALFKAIQEVTGISQVEMQEPGRSNEGQAFAKAMYVRIIKEETGKTFREIGEDIGRNVYTAMHHYHEAYASFMTDLNYSELAKKVREIFKENKL